MHEHVQVHAHVGTCTCTHAHARTRMHRHRHTTQAYTFGACSYFSPPLQPRTTTPVKASPLKRATVPKPRPLRVLSRGAAGAQHIQLAPRHRQRPRPHQPRGAPPPLRLSLCLTSRLSPLPRPQPSPRLAMHAPYMLQVLLMEFLAGDEYVVDTVSRDGVHKCARPRAPGHRSVLPRHRASGQELTCTRSRTRVA